jgi:hypothetical protein
MLRSVLFPPLLVAALALPAGAQSLSGSAASIARQAEIARQHDFTLLKDPAHIARFARLGLLVPLRDNADYQLSGVSFPFARPETRTFVERLSSQYRSACGEKLAVTSLTRPLSGQPPNASPLSVHPAGMAIDLRVSRDAACRRWMERVLLDLEKKGVIEATLERRPLHYHVAVFPRQYEAYIRGRK